MSTHQYGEKSWNIPNQLEAVTRLAREAAEWADDFPISEQSKYSIRLALEEMLTNTVKYGYDDPHEHLISVQIRADSELIRITLEDDARPFDPTANRNFSLDNQLDSDQDGGFGIELVRQICKTIAYRREDQLNRLVMKISVMDADDDHDETATPPTPTETAAP